MAGQPRLFDLPDAPEPWELAAEADLLTAEIVLPLPTPTTFHYLVPDALRDLIRPGQRVKVPFGRGDQLKVGFVVAVGSPPPAARRLKSIDALIDREPLIAGDMLELTKWISERYLGSWGQVLDSVIPAGVKKQAGTREIRCFQLAEGALEKAASLKLPARQRAVLEVLQEADGPVPVDQLEAAAQCGTSPIHALRDKKLIVPVRQRRSTMTEEYTPAARTADLILNPDQQTALDAILEPLQAPRHETILLHGVTGSGKTEIYIRAIREVVSYGRQAIVLVPEISLTPQTIRRFGSRFSSLAVLHSHLSDAERHWHWQRIASGEVEVVIGARSAVFAPTPHLGIIVLDEEHETTFKQNATPRYHAREVARERARRAGVPLVLGSATPTLESFDRAQRGLDRLIEMPNRVEQRPLPPVVIVDTRNDALVPRGHSIGRALKHSIERSINEGGQVILFLNLRGYSPVLWCLKCNEGVKCPDCDISLTWHRDRGKLLCHSCDFEMPPPERCPSCGQPGQKYLGAGTQKLEQEVRSKFPDARIVRMDSDAMRKPGSHDEALERFRKGEIDILLGTQMIAKGLDFPNVTLVGVIDADSMLHQPDLRAAERTFQLIAQVAGRTGRGEKAGRVIVQTMSPDDAVIQLAAEHDYLGFAKRELAQRREHHAPPATNLARVIVRGPREDLVRAEIRKIVETLKETAKGRGDDLRILGPAPAPILRLKKLFRYHCQLSAPTIEQILEWWRAAEARFSLPDEVELTIDVDPLDLR
ncbi:Primosomal protein N' [Caulifigura coniformis]|uniref:Replication restart protein PriA n=1 Tax=Caulifigura coniformis TaxID=2527983 RepID=A0A517SJ56_9PLAN|nr:primosomal protein N' [Caulifigura coniformis]QDT56157.1 Primosomal protein N' [Caulifigura coniformis]